MSNPTPKLDARHGRRLGEHPATAAVVIVGAATAISILAPDLVTGSAHEHLPLAALTVWPWAAAAVGYVLMAGRHDYSRDLVLAVSFVWVLVAILAVGVPTLVTGTDPTHVPLAALIAPPFGAVITGFLCIAHARAPSTRESRTSHG
ncbi:hypothetical protein [Nocardioides sp.]|uniref:hypothetical protein n=1 Tax=Nocardioides sp. TaxID=35761 RepID=UPI003D0C60A2